MTSAFINTNSWQLRLRLLNGNYGFTFDMLIECGNQRLSDPELLGAMLAALS